MNEDRFVADLREVLLRVRVVRFGWRARLASWLLRLAAWVGGAQLEFLGEDETP